MKAFDEISHHLPEIQAHILQQISFWEGDRVSGKVVSPKEFQVASKKLNDLFPSTGAGDDLIRVYEIYLRGFDSEMRDHSKNLAD